MKSYCLKCRKDTENVNAKTSNKRSRFIENQETKGLLSNLGIRTPLSKVSLLVDILFWMQFHWSATLLKYNKWMK